MRRRLRDTGRGRHSRRSLAGGLALLGGLVLPALAVGRADEPVRIFEWRDERGVVRYTPHRDRIPREVLATAVVIEHGADGRAFSYREGVDGDPALHPEPSVERAVRKVVVLEPAPPEPSTGSLDGAPFPTQGLGPDEDRCRVAPIADLTPWLRPLEHLELLPEHRLYGSRVEVEGRVWQRVRLGFFPSVTAARRALRRLESSFPDAWIAPVNEAERQAAETPEVVRADGGALSEPGAAHFAVQLGALPFRDCTPLGEQLMSGSTSD